MDPLYICEREDKGVAEEERRCIRKRVSHHYYQGYNQRALPGTRRTRVFGPEGG